MDKTQLESLIQREAEKYTDSINKHFYIEGARSLAPALLETMGALDNSLWCAENFQAESEEWQNKYHKATEALQRINELLEGGKKICPWCGKFYS